LSLPAAVSRANSIRSRYSSVAIALHWTIAALIIFDLILGSVMESFPQSIRFLLVRTHATAGLLVLLLHVAGALKHQWIDKHAELARMGIGGVRRQ
jgi:cytochrome b561